MTVERLDCAESLVDSGEYAKAVGVLKALADDASCADSIKADALQFLGNMTQYAPTEVGDDYALPYYQRALKLCPDHLWALFGIVTTYGEHAPEHCDKEAFFSALKRLLLRLDELSPSAADDVRDRTARFGPHSDDEKRVGER